eukprot:5067780-Alexandrium_andersonii.AAC.1
MSNAAGQAGHAGSDSTGVTLSRELRVLGCAPRGTPDHSEDMAVLSRRGPARSGQGGRVGGRARPDLALRIVASHAGGELELAPVVMTRLEAFQL